MVKWAAGLAMVLLLSSCGDSTTAATTTTAAVGTTTTQAVAIAYPTGADQSVVVVRSGGGFLPPEIYFRQLVPGFVLAGDGRVVTIGPGGAPASPAFPSLQERTISKAGITEILESGRSAGLFDETIDFGRPGVTDLGSTGIVIVADGRTHTTGIYALGFNDDKPGLDLTVAQSEARGRVTRFLRSLEPSVGRHGDSARPYSFSAMALFSFPARSATSNPETDWPLADLASFGEPYLRGPGSGVRCAVVRGGDLDRVVDAMKSATSETVWRSQGTRYDVIPRPLFPHEKSCDDV